MILAAYREIELDRRHPLAAALVEWNRERIATRFSLGRLTFDETSALLAILFGQENISEELTRALYAETEGNPFFIEEVVKALIEQGQIYRENNQWERKDISELAIPQSVKEAIGRRLNRLSEPCLEVLHTRPRLGKEFDFAEFAAVSPSSEDQLLDALDEASTAQLVKAKSSGIVLLHSRQNPGGPVRGDQPYPPQAPAPAHWRSPGKTIISREAKSTSRTWRITSPRAGTCRAA